MIVNSDDCKQTGKGSILDFGFAILDLRFWICDFGLLVKHLGSV
ncbi:hypothetical protein O77CONTIG1_02885 [Leptolyngbya sp. O-77]|nr:hypothetical protein O77CONTIG1_02885 [Leptolyngbya sp. O-77]